jgi:hypothetical protein
MNIEGKLKLDTKVEVSIEKKQEREKFIFKGVLNPLPGQRVFKLDQLENTLSECEYIFMSDTINYMDLINNTVKDNREILIEEGFDYVIKLNISNAKKFFDKKWNIKSIIDKTSSQKLKRHGKVTTYKHSI